MNNKQTQKSHQGKNSKGGKPEKSNLICKLGKNLFKNKNDPNLDAYGEKSKNASVLTHTTPEMMIHKVHENEKKDNDVIISKQRGRPLSKHEEKRNRRKNESCRKIAAAAVTIHSFGTLEKHQESDEKCANRPNLDNNSKLKPNNNSIKNRRSRSRSRKKTAESSALNSSGFPPLPSVSNLDKKIHRRSRSRSCKTRCKVSLSHDNHIEKIVVIEEDNKNSKNEMNYLRNRFVRDHGLTGDATRRRRSSQNRENVMREFRMKRSFSSNVVTQVSDTIPKNKIRENNHAYNNNKDDKDELIIKTSCNESNTQFSEMSETSQLSTTSNAVKRRRRPPPLTEETKQQQSQNECENNSTTNYSNRKRSICNISMNESTNKSLKEIKERNREDAASRVELSDVEDEVDPLDFLEIKSAAQWKAMSKRISWNFENTSPNPPIERRHRSLSKDKSRNNKKSNINASTNNSYSPPMTPIKRRNFEIDFTIRAPNIETSVDGFKPTKVTQLRLVCWKVKPWNKPKNSKLFSSQFAIAWQVDCDEVFPNLFVGDKASASNIPFLKKHGITHILNTAEGKDEGLVDLSQEYFRDSGITYLGFPLWDCPNCNILPYLGPASEFINKAIENGGKCLVNCQMGVSRSSSCAMSYLMIYKNMTAVQVLTQFRENRDVRPNDGFLQIIVNLDNDLRLERLYQQQRLIKLASISDLPKLPQAFNFEFWVDESRASEEEIGLSLIKLGENRKVMTPQLNSFAPSRTLSRKSSMRGGNKSRSNSRLSSKKSSFRSSRGTSISRHESFSEQVPKVYRTPSISITPPQDDVGIDPEEEENDEDQWEWFWEDEEKVADKEVASVMNSVPPSPQTTKKLEEVKDIIEKPEERWRILWNKTRGSIDNTPTSPSAASVKSINSNLSIESKYSNLIQPGVDENDVLSMVKVVSAKQWKAISEKVTINFDDINLAPEIENDQNRVKTPLDFTPSNVKQLRLICWRIKPWDQPKDRNLFTSVLASGWGVDCDEVYPNLFIGDEASARNISFLRKMGITHVLNTAEGIWTDHSFVDLTNDYYNNSGIVYQGFNLWDSTKVKISPYFGPANEFISNSLKSGGKCLVNCQMGVSRSCICAMAYMMLSEKWKACDVLRQFRKCRDVRPNDHFLSQIVDLDNILRKSREFNLPSNEFQLKTLNDVKYMPKPYHKEFWDVIPESNELPFELIDKTEESISKETKSAYKKSDELVQEMEQPSGSLALPAGDCLGKRLSIISNASAVSSEWEYYYSTEEEDEGDGNVIENTEQTSSSNGKDKNTDIFDKKVGSAHDWKIICDENKGITMSEEDDYQGISKTEVNNKFEPTTEKQLRLICWKIKPWKEKKMSKMFSSQFALLWNVDCDEVYPNLFIGDAAAASNIKFLKHLGIKHVLNTAEGKDDGLVDLSLDYFQDSGISYLGLLMWDNEWFDVSPFINQAVEFINQAMENGEKILVNCQMGVSRSSTCAIAYMMKIKGWNAVDALKQFRGHRDVRPNDGFMKYIVTLDNQLRKTRYASNKEE